MRKRAGTGSTGNLPVPRGTERCARNFVRVLCQSDIPSLPSGQWPDGTGGSPVPPKQLRPQTKIYFMTTARDTIVDALDIESFVLCESEPEAKELVGKLMSSLGLGRFVIVSLDFNGPGAHFRVRAYMNKPGDTYTWLKE